MELKHAAKRKMLESLKSEMSKEDSMGLPELLKGKKLEKVVVASDSKKGLETGLDKAKEILKKRSEMMGMDSEVESEEEEIDEEPVDKEEIRRQIAELQEKLGE